MTGNRRPWVRDRRLALWGGVLLLSLGSALLYDAYEGRGRQRPFVTRFLPV